MSYYWFNRKDILQKQKTDIITVAVKKKLLNIILKTGGFKGNANNKYRSLSGEEKEEKNEYQRNRYRNIKAKTSQKSNKQLKY